MKNGRSEKELFQTLKEMDRLTGVDSLLLSGQSVTLTARRERGKIKNWRITEDPDGFKSRSDAKKGSGFSSLLKALESLDKALPADDRLVVLCLVESGLARTWEGKIQTTWMLIDPCLPFEVKDGKVDFPMINLELAESEYKVCMESRIAFYDEFTEILYPIRKAAFSSIGKLMDSEAAFKYLSQIPLGSAFLLAERIAGAKNLQLIYRDKTKKVKPLIGVAGNRYQRFPQEELFQEFLKKAQERFICRIGKWSVTDEASEADILIDCAASGDYQLLLRARTSDIPGNSVSLRAIAKIGGGEILLCENTAYHNLKFTQKGGVEVLFHDMEYAIERFESRYALLQSATIAYEGGLPKKIANVIGKKRAAKARAIPAGVYNGAELFVKVVEESFPKGMKPKQIRSLGRECFAFFDELAEVARAKGKAAV